MTNNKINILSFFISVIIVIIIASFMNLNNNQSENSIIIENYNVISVDEYVPGNTWEFENNNYCIIQNTIVEEKDINSIIEKYGKNSVIIINNIEKTKGIVRVIIAIKQK